MPIALAIYLFSLVLGYVFGAFPTGYFVGKLWNVDVRRHGSGRTGGTNVLRTVGWPAFLMTAIGDILKGFLAVVLARVLFPTLHGAHALALLGVLIGHNWSLWIALLDTPNTQVTQTPGLLGRVRSTLARARGGAGIGATAGATLGLFPPALAIVFPVFLVVLVVVRYASVASLTSSIVYPLLMLAFALNGSVPWTYFIAAVAAAGIIIFVHKPNIERLRAGTEKRFGQRIGH